MSLIEEGFSLPLIIFSWGWFHLFYFYSNGYCLLVCQHINLFSAAFVFGEKRGKPFSFLCHEHIHSPPPFSLFVSQQHDFTMPSCQKKLLLPWRHALDQERRAGRVCDNGFVWDFIVTWGQFTPVSSGGYSLGILFHQLHLIMNARLFKVSEEFSWDENLLFGRLITYVLCRL